MGRMVSSSPDPVVLYARTHAPYYSYVDTPGECHDNTYVELVAGGPCCAGVEKEMQEREKRAELAKKEGHKSTALGCSARPRIRVERIE